MADSIEKYVSASCEVKLPKPGSDPHEYVSRWSDVSVSVPAAVVVPLTEDDCIAAVRYAAKNGLRVIPANGGHGSFVPIDSKTVYLDMKNFNQIDLDPTQESVTIGGGAITGDVLRTCQAQGFYTLTVNSNAVGMIGAMLGGGSSAFNGNHGMGVDHVLSVRLITSHGKVLDLSPDSNGDEKDLFHALCGAGHGLGVITSMKLRAFPISNLMLTNNGVWQRQLVFPAPAINVAAELYTQLQPPVASLSPVLIFARSPADSPGKGAPLVVLSVSYFGPQEEAEQAAAAALTQEVEGSTISARTVHTPLQKINDAAESHNFHGGFKEYYSCFLEKISAESIKKTFARFVEHGDAVEDAKSHSKVVISSWNIEAASRNAARSKSGSDETYFLHRDRGLSVHFTPSYSQETSKQTCAEFGNQIIDIVREMDDANGKAKAGFVNNLRLGQGLEEMYSPSQLERLRRIKERWDPHHVFWSPVNSV